MHFYHLTPEEWELIQRRRAGRSNLEWLKTVDDWSNPPPIEPPSPPAPPAPPGRAETLADQAIEVFLLELSVHLYYASNGHLDSGNLLLAVIRLFQRYNLPLPLDLPAPPPPRRPRKRGRGRPPVATKPMADFRQSRAIHAEIKARFTKQHLSLERPRQIPHGDALTALLDRQADAIDKAKAEAGRDKLLTKAINAYWDTQPYGQDNNSAAKVYRRHRRALLIHDLAADLFIGFLIRFLREEPK